MSDHPFETYDGAFVLGVLSSADSSAFDQHLESCDAYMNRRPRRSRGRW